MSLEQLRDHLANERTYLAWIRTAIGMIVFGFAVGRFGLALRQLAFAGGAKIRTTGLSLWFGSSLIIFGVVMMVGAFVRYRRVRSEISQGKFSASSSLVVVVTSLSAALGLALVVYLVLTERTFS